MMDPDEFHIELKDIIAASNTDILSFPLLKCGYTYFGDGVKNFFLVTVDYECYPSDIGAKQVAYGKWVLMLDKNCIEDLVKTLLESSLAVILRSQIHHPLIVPRSSFCLKHSTRVASIFPKQHMMEKISCAVTGRFRWLAAAWLKYAHRQIIVTLTS